MPDPFAPEQTALLIMDVQATTLANNAEPAPAFLARLDEVRQAARAAGVRVVYVVVSFRPGHPEISPRNRVFSRHKGAATLVDVPGPEGLTPGPDEPVVVKKRISAFAGSDLDLILRSAGIEHLILTGIATSGVVLSTLLEAADRDYRLTVLGDGCLDRDPEVHALLLGKLFPRQADIMTCAEAAEALRATPRA